MLYRFLQYHTNDSYCGVPLFPSQVKEALQKTISSLQRPTLTFWLRCILQSACMWASKTLAFLSLQLVEVKTMIEVRFDQQPGESHSRFGFLPVTLAQLYNSTHRFAIMMLLTFSRIRFLLVQVTPSMFSSCRPLPLILDTPPDLDIHS